MYKYRLYQVLNQRDGLEDTAREEWDRLQTGREGEQIFQDFVDRFWPEDFPFWHNVDIEFQGRRCQIDYLGFVNGKIYIYEIKHYQADLTYENDHWTFTDSNQELFHDPIQQVKRTCRILKDILSKEGSLAPVHGLLVFTNRHQEITNHTSNESKIEIIPQYQLRKHLLNLHPRYYSPDPYLEEILNAYRSPYLYTWQPEWTTWVTRARGGILCPKCGMEYGVSNHLCFFCSCGFKEPRLSALTRTLQDYCLLYPFDTNISRGFQEFCQCKISKCLLHSVLNKNLDKDDRRKRHSYINPYRKQVRPVSWD